MPGRYVENLRILGKSIVLRSTAPTDLAVVKATILDGNRAGSVITFAGTEGTTCVLAGFNITNGDGDRNAQRAGGGILGNDTLATIEHNYIFDNIAAYGGGIHGCDGIIQNSIISNNRAEVWGQSIGGGLGYCDGTIQNNLICFNISKGTAIPGGSGTGGGLGFCEGIIQNNTIYGNTCTGFQSAGSAGILNLRGTIRNCIFWQNEPLATQVSFVFGGPPVYSYIQDWTGAGTGNISSDPLFVDAANDDFHLRSNSPCINAGLTIPALQRDFEGNPRSRLYDIGAYEYFISTNSTHWQLYY